MKTTTDRLVLGVALAAVVLASTSPARAHCDTMRGPVVADARAALEAGDVSLVLHWVRPEDEAAVREAFEETMTVRALGPEARALADRSFFETLVRIHRAGEGAPYTGLRDEDPEPIIAATDRVLARGSSEELSHLLGASVRSGLDERFAAATAARDFRRGDVEAGRQYVAAYVSLTHWVEGVSAAVAGTADHHAGVVPHAAAPALGGGEGHETHGGPAPARHLDTRPLPWLLAGVLGVVALVESALLFRRRRR